MVAEIRTVWAPSASALKLAEGAEQPAAAAASSLQVVLVGELVAVKLTATAALGLNELSAGELIETTGMSMTVKLRVTAALPPEFDAETVSEWLPALSAVFAIDAGVQLLMTAPLSN